MSGKRKDLNDSVEIVESFSSDEDNDRDSPKTQLASKYPVLNQLKGVAATGASNEQSQGKVLPTGLNEQIDKDQLEALQIAFDFDMQNVQFNIEDAPTQSDW